MRQSFARIAIIALLAGLLAGAPEALAQGAVVIFGPTPPPAPPVPGSLTVTLGPEAVLETGAWWSVDGGSQQLSGATVTGLTPGDHTVGFATTSGLFQAATQIAHVVSGQTSVLTATFTPSVFVRKAAGYTGLMNAGGDITTPGLITLNITAQNYLSGRLVIDGESHVLRGMLSNTGDFMQSLVAREGQTMANPTLLLQFLNDGTFSGALRDGLVAASAISGEMNRVGYPQLPAGGAGLYNSALSGQSAPVQGAAGFLQTRVLYSGATILLGALPDGARVLAASHISISGKVPVALRLYSGEGSLSGTATLGGDVQTTLQATLDWSRPRLSGKMYPDGFYNALVAVNGFPWKAPARGIRLVPDFDAAGGKLAVTLSGGDLTSPIIKAATLTPGNALTITSPAADRLKIRINPRSGLFAGSFVQPNGLARTLSGIFVQATPGTIEGFFPGASAPGLVTMMPSP